MQILENILTSTESEAHPALQVLLELSVSKLSETLLRDSWSKAGMGTLLQGVF